VAVNKNQEREAREARERLRLYNARQSVHEHQVRRRVRDNWIAVAALVVVAALATTTQIFYFSAGPGVPAPVPTATDTATPAAGANVGNVPSPDVSEYRTWTGQLTLNDTVLDIQLDGAAAPQAVAAFVTDVKSGYYTGKNCHRLVQDASTGLIQCGSEKGDGTSDPTTYAYGPIENAPSDGIYPAGTIAIARTSSAYGNGHQFFICFDDSTLPDPTGYTVIGTVTSGLNALKSGIVAGGITPGSSATDGSPTTPTVIANVTIQ
jgi:peptidyl-prolyl cis-trans isomerase B (cyclophilin B)